MALELQNRVVELVADALGAEMTRVTPDFLMRPGPRECLGEWTRVRRIYTALTTLELPHEMPPRERRSVDAVICVEGTPPFILEVDEAQHFNAFRAATLEHYPARLWGFGLDLWRTASLAKSRLEQGGFAKPCPPLFPGANGRHRQRAFRDALCDLLPPLHGWGPTLRIAHFEVASWVFGAEARDRMGALVAGRDLGLRRIR